MNVHLKSKHCMSFDKKLITQQFKQLQFLGR